MIPEMRPYSGGPVSPQEVVALVQTEEVSLRSDSGGATGSELGNSRLMNFLSDDAAPRDRDMDTLMSQPDYERLEAEPPSEVLALPAPDAPPPPEPLAEPPLERLFEEQLERTEDEDLYRGSSLGSYAQDMYTATRDVLSRAAA